MELQAILSVLRLQLQHINVAIRSLEDMGLARARFERVATILNSENSASQPRKRKGRPPGESLDLLSVQLEEASTI